MVNVRAFDGSNDFITLALGSLASVHAGPCTLAAIIRSSLNGSFRPFLSFETSGPSQRLALWKNSSNNLMFSQGGLDRDIALSMTIATAWIVTIVTKTSNGTPRGHRYIYSTDTWGHANAGDTSDDDSETLSQIKIGRYEGDADTWNGRIALLAALDDVIGDDAAIEAMNLEVELANWLTPFTDGGIWPLNQASTATAVEDITGNGADQTALSGTSVVDDTDLTFDFDLGGMDLDLNVGFFQKTKSFFVPTLQNQTNENLSVGFFQKTKSFFSPILQLQDAQTLNVGFKTGGLQLFTPGIVNESDSNLLVGHKSSSLSLFQPTIFNEGDEMFEPTLVGEGSLADQILAGLESQGFEEGSLADREYARLLSKLGLAYTDGYSIQDLYSLADEPNRIAGLVEEEV
jgi:hypothetical protein